MRLGACDVAQHASDAIRIVGLRHESRAGHRLRDPVDGSRRIDDPHTRIELAGEPRERRAIHRAGEIDVCEQDVDGQSASEPAQRILATERDMDLEALAFERVGGLDADQRLVLDHEHPAPPPVPAVALAAIAMFPEGSWIHGPLLIYRPLVQSRAAGFVSKPTRGVAIYGWRFVNDGRARREQRTMEHHLRRAPAVA